MLKDLPRDDRTKYDKVLQAELEEITYSGEQTVDRTTSQSKGSRLSRAADRRMKLATFYPNAGELDTMLEGNTRVQAVDQWCNLPDAGLSNLVSHIMDVKHAKLVPAIVQDARLIA